MASSEPEICNFIQVEEVSVPPVNRLECARDMPGFPAHRFYFSVSHFTLPMRQAGTRLARICKISRIRCSAQIAQLTSRKENSCILRRICKPCLSLIEARRHNVHSQPSSPVRGRRESCTFAKAKAAIYLSSEREGGRDLERDI